MGFFDNARDNYERRQKIAEYNYKAREYISDGQRIYEDAYNSLCDAVYKVDKKVYKYQQYKQDTLNEINRSLRNLDSNHKEFKISTSVNFMELDSCAVHQMEKLDVVDKILATWVQPSVSDFFRDNTMDYYEARSNMNSARSYKDRMKIKREELRNAKYAVQRIPDFIYEEQKQIDELMQKFRKTVDSISKEYSSEKADALTTIANKIAQFTTTNFIDNNYEITDNYKDVSNQLKRINNSLSSAAWLIGG